MKKNKASGYDKIRLVIMPIIAVLIIGVTGSVLWNSSNASASVVDIQKKLQYLGCAPGSADGVYGAMTTQAVKRFQVANSLYIDGQAGPKTQSVLFGSGAKKCVYTGKAAPLSSGSGVRTVVSQSQNWVWVIGSGGVLADGGMIDNPAVLKKGTYRACEWIDPNRDFSLEYRLNKFIRFCNTSGLKTGMGFHEIPIKISTNTRIHSESLLGTNSAESHGCVRVGVGMASALWHFTRSSSAYRSIVVI